MRNKIIGGLLCLALGAGFAFAQSQSVQQSGTVTAGHVAGWAYNGIVQDGGTTVNPNLTAIGAYGTGDVHCISNTKVRTGGWYNLCLGYATNSSSAYITLTPFGGAPSIPLTITADGSAFPIGPGSLSTLLDQQMGSIQGEIIYRNATTWVALPPAVSGFLATNGSGANPSWSAGTALSAIAANSALANTTGSSAVPTAVALPSCSTSGNFLQYTTNTGFSCGVTTTIIQNYKSGLILSTAGSSGTFGISAGEAADTTNVAMMSLANAYTKTTGAWSAGSGQGCLSTGSIANSTWYSEYIIERTDNGVTDILCDTSATSPTLPSPYTLYRRIGSMKTDSSAHWTAFTQLANQFLWVTPVRDSNGVTFTDVAALVTLSIPTGVRVEAIFSTNFVYTSTGDFILITSPDQADTTPSPNQYNAIVAANIANTIQPFSIRTNISGQVRFRSTTTGGTTDATYTNFTSGWNDSFGGN